jgi:Amiloride-sensitive sodium channel
MPCVCLCAGLRLTLNIEHDDYLGLFSHKAGVRVTIHPFDVTPFPEDFGLNAMPGCETEIGVAVVRAIKMLRLFYNELPCGE